MTKRFNFRKPYYRMTEKDMGMAPMAIVTYEKRGEFFNSRTLTEQERKEKGYSVETYAIEFRHFLVIDLWILVMRFDWRTKVKQHD